MVIFPDLLSCVSLFTDLSKMASLCWLGSVDLRGSVRVAVLLFWVDAQTQQSGSSFWVRVLFPFLSLRRHFICCRSSACCDAFGCFLGKCKLLVLVFEL